MLWINWETELGIVLVLISDLGKSFPLVACFPIHETESAFCVCSPWVRLVGAGVGTSLNQFKTKKLVLNNGASGYIDKCDVRRDGYDI